MITLFGIKNCSTVRKAISWLEEHQCPYIFHDYKKLGIQRETVEGWVGALGWQQLLNTRGTTWRKVSEDLRKDIDAQRAVDLMVAQPSLIRRPVLVGPEILIVGFSEADYARVGRMPE